MASQHEFKRYDKMHVKVQDLTASGDVAVTGDLAITGDLTVTGATVSAGDYALNDDDSLVLGTGLDAELLWSTGDASNHAAVLALGDSNQSLHVTDVGAKATDWNVSADTHPTVYVHSNTTPATDYMTVGPHDGTIGHVNVVGGTTLSLDVGGTPEVLMTASILDLTSTDLQVQASGQILDDNGNELIEFKETASAVNGLRIVNSATGVKPIITNEGEADTGITLANFDGTNTEEILILAAVATGVNELTITNAATGNPALITASGETNVSIAIAAKGSGYTRFTTGGLQVHSTSAVTATADGLTTGLIPQGVSFVVVTSANADHIINLPAATVGDRMRILIGATACELRSVTALDKVNDVVVGTTNEAVLTATNLYDCQYVAANTWVVIGYTKLGAVQAALVPDAV